MSSRAYGIVISILAPRLTACFIVKTAGGKYDEQARNNVTLPAARRRQLWEK